MCGHTPRWIWLATALLALLAAPSAAAPPAASVGNEFGAFNFTLDGRTPEARVELLERLGYQGIALAWDKPESIAAYLALPAIKQGRFKLHAVLYSLDFGKGLDGSGAEAVMKVLEGTKTPLWMTFNGPKEELNKAVATMGDLARTHKVTLVVYPHKGNVIASAEDALAVFTALKRTDIKLSLHLCHEFKAGNRDRLEAVIKKAMPYTVSATINGTFTVDGKGGWERTILRLDRGDFNVRDKWLRPLLRAGYRGPFTLHTWGLKDPPEEHFAASMAVWKQMVHDAVAAQ